MASYALVMDGLVHTSDGPVTVVTASYTLVMDGLVHASDGPDGLVTFQFFTFRLLFSQLGMGANRTRIRRLADSQPVLPQGRSEKLQNFSQKFAKISFTT